MADLKILAAFHQVEILNELCAESREFLASYSSFRPIRKGETLFCENEPSPYCFGFLSGEITLVSSKEPEKINRYGPGQLLGGLSLLAERPRPGLASVVADGQLLAVCSSRFREWVKNERQKNRQPAIVAELQNRLQK